MVPASSYPLIFFGAVLILTVLKSVRFFFTSNRSFFLERNENIALILTTILLVLFIGLRPVDPFFVDTIAYASLFELYQTGDYSVIYHSSEIAFNTLAILCAKYGNIEIFFTILAFFYFAPVAYVSARMCKSQPFATYLFFLGSFSFYSYSVNVLRNGVATSLILLMFTLVYIDKKKVLGVIVGILGILFHTAVLLPFCAIFVSLIPRHKNLPLIIWFVSIALSLTVPSLFTFLSDIIEAIIQDDRISTYTANSLGNPTGFRSDFLIYSSFPVIISLMYRRYSRDSNIIFEHLLTTYLLCNAFWIIFIRASFSDRFAYLSWFLYPLLLAYPLFNIKVFRNQGKLAAGIMLFMISFTIVSYYCL